MSSDEESEFFPGEDDDDEEGRGGGEGGEGEGEDGGRGEMGFPHTPITQQMMQKGLSVLAKVCQMARE